MDVEYLLGSLLRSVLSSRGKRKKMTGAMRYVLGDRRMAGGAMPRLYLRQVGTALSLDDATVARLEQQAAATIRGAAQDTDS